MKTARLTVRNSLLLSLALGVPTTALASTLIDVEGRVRQVIADPSRNVVYAALDAGKIITIDATTGAITLRRSIASAPGDMVVAEDGSRLFVYLADLDTVAELKLPEQDLVRYYESSGTRANVTGVGTAAGRLFVNRHEGLSILDTTSGNEIYFGNPDDTFHHWTYSRFLRVSPDGRTLYAQDQGISPSSIFVFDITQDTPRYRGEECCHACLGSPGRGVEFPPNEDLLYVLSGLRLYILSSTPLLPARYVGHFANFGGAAFAMSEDGSQIYVVADDEIAVIRASDWLTYHVLPLQGRGSHQGLALALDQRTLAVALEPFVADSTYIELIDVASLVPNRGGIRLRPLDDRELAPIYKARIRHPIQQGATGFFDWEAAALGRTPMEPGVYEIEITAPGHETVTLDVTVTPGAWTDLGDLVMTRVGDMPRPTRICAAPAARIGRTTRIEVTGLGFLEGEDLLLKSFNPDYVVEDFEFESWVRLRATVTVRPEALPRLTNGLDVVNGDGQSSVFGDRIVLLPPEELFADGFESGDTSAWSSMVP